MLSVIAIVIVDLVWAFSLFLIGLETMLMVCTSSDVHFCERVMVCEGVCGGPRFISSIQESVNAGDGEREYGGSLAKPNTASNSGDLSTATNALSGTRLAVMFGISKSSGELSWLELSMVLKSSPREALENVN